MRAASYERRVVIRTSPVVPPSIQHRRDFGLDIRHMVRTMLVDNFLRSFNSKPVEGCRTAMQMVGHNRSDNKDNYCEGVEHVIQNLDVLKEKENQRGSNQWASNVDQKGTQNQDPETRGEGKVEVSGVRSIRPLRTATRIAVFSMASAVQTTGAQIMLLLMTPISDQTISFPAVAAPTDEEALWPFDPTKETDGTSELFGSFGGGNGEETRRL